MTALNRFGPTTCVTAWAERRPILFFVALILIGLTLRLPLLFGRDLWYDEIWQHYIVAGPVSGLGERVVEADRYPPGFAWLCVPVVAVTDSQPALRLVSLAAGLAAIPLAWAAGRWTFGPGCGVVAACLTAVCPAYVFFSREARAVMLSVTAVFALLAVVAAAARRPGARTVIACASAAVGVALTQYAGAVVAAVVLAVTLAGAVAARDRRLATAPAAALAALVTVGVWLYFAYAAPQIRRAGTGAGDAFLAGNFFVPRDSDAVARFTVVGTLDLAQFLATGHRFASPRFDVGLITLAATAVAAAVAVGRGTGGRWVLAVVACEVGLFVSLAGAGLHPYGGIHHCLPLTPAVVLCVAAAVAKLAARKRAYARLAGELAFVALLGLAGYSLVRSVPHRRRHDVSAVIAAVGPRLQPGDAVVAADRHVFIMLANEITGDSGWAYRENEACRRAGGVVTTGVEWAGRRVVCAVGPEHVGRAASACGASRVWVINREPVGDPAGRLGPGEGFRPVDEVLYDGCRATCWQRVVQ